MEGGLQTPVRQTMGCAVGTRNGFPLFPPHSSHPLWESILSSQVHFLSVLASVAGLVWPWLILKLPIYRVWGQIEDTRAVSMRSGLLESGFQSAVTYLLSEGPLFFCSFQNSIPLCLAMFSGIRARGQLAVTVLIPGTEAYFPHVNHIQEGEKLHRHY